MDFYNLSNEEYRELAKSHSLTPIVKVELLDEYERAYRELIQEISSEEMGSISQNLQQGVRSTINFSIFDPTGKFLPNPNDRLFWIGRRFKVYIGLTTKRFFRGDNLLTRTGDKEDQISSTTYHGTPQVDVLKVSSSSKDYEVDNYWFPKGVYILTSIEASNSSSGKLISISGVDKFGAFTNDSGYNQMIGTFCLKKGQKIETAIKEILKQDIGNGQSIDPIDPIVDPFYQDYSLPLDIDKGPGSYVGELLIDLANMLHADIYYDENGRLNVWQSLNADEYKNITKLWDFTYGDTEYISTSVTFELQNVANSIYVTGDNPSAKILPVAWVENNNPSSPVAIQKIGRKTRYIESSTIQTQKEAKDYARYILKTSSILGHSISFNCTFIPHLSLDGVITLTDDYLGYNRENFLISSLNFPLGPGEISITASSIKELPEE